jgi:hypothetical protein
MDQCSASPPAFTKQGGTEARFVWTIWGMFYWCVWLNRGGGCLPTLSPAKNAVWLQVTPGSDRRTRHSISPSLPPTFPQIATDHLLSTDYPSSTICWGNKPYFHPNSCVIEYWNGEKYILQAVFLYLQILARRCAFGDSTGCVMVAIFCCHYDRSLQSVFTYLWYLRIWQNLNIFEPE